MEGAVVIERAAAASRTAGSGLFLTCIHAFLVEALLCTGAYPAGLAAVRDGLEVARRSFGCGYEPELWRLRGELLLASAPEDPAQAEAAFLKAIELARATQARALELKAALSLVRTWRQRGRADEARELLAGLVSWFTGRRMCPDAAAAREFLREPSV